MYTLDLIYSLKKVDPAILSCFFFKKITEDDDDGIN